MTPEFKGLIPGIVNQTQLNSSELAAKEEKVPFESFPVILAASTVRSSKPVIVDEAIKFDNSNKKLLSGSSQLCPAVVFVRVKFKSWGNFYF